MQDSSDQDSTRDSSYPNLGYLSHDAARLAPLTDGRALEKTHFSEGAQIGSVPRPPEGVFVLFGVLFAAQHDDPKKQDRQHGTNDSNSGRIHRISPFLITVNSAFLGPSFRRGPDV
jgi:hypothetical protein